jgi:ribosomal protein S18 acetylase RimI-like enzyme
MKSIDIEYATPHDVESIIQVHYRAVHESASAYYSKEILDNWSGPLSPERIARLAKALANPKTIFLVAREQEKVVGMGIVDLDRNYLGAIYVHPSVGRKGVGRKLLDRLEILTREQGLTWLQLDASLNAEAFYLKHGYQVVEKGFHTLASGLQMPCIKMIKRFPKTPLRLDFPDFKLKSLKAHIRLGETGALKLLDAGRAWNLAPTLQAGGSLIFPHLAIEICGHQIAAAVQACLDSGTERVLALGVIHASTPELNEARIRVARGSNPAQETSWGVQGPGLNGRQDWCDEFSLDHFLFLWNVEIKRRNIAGPELILRYPYLAGGKPHIMPGMEELQAIAKEAVVVATMDPFHHGIGYGEPPESALWPEKGGLDLARRRIIEGLELFSKGDYWGYNQHCVQAKSDGRDVGQVLRYLRGPLQGSILNLVAEDTTVDYQQPPPTWVAGALIALKPV